MKTVQVLMSTYNGEKYLREQIDSILHQKDVLVTLLIRDDGSTDSTCEIIQKYAANYKNIQLIKGENVGYRKSFMELVSLACDHDYYAFSDQDDVWKENKLARAVARARDAKVENDVVLYFSNCTLVSEDLTEIGALHSVNPLMHTKDQALIEGFAHGCTLVFPEATLQLVKQYNPKINVAHDFWIPMLVFFLGKIIYDDSGAILYRQHDNNTFGNNVSYQKLFKNMWQQFFTEGRNTYSTIIAEFVDAYGHLLSKSEEEHIKKIVSYRKSWRKKWHLLINKNMRKKSFKGTITVKILILSSKF